MAYRTDAAAVQGVLMRDYDTARAPNLTPFIAAASSVVSRVVACATLKSITISDSDQELVERWLAAHIYKQSDQAVASRNTGGAGGSFQGQTGMYLEGTKYGQTALVLDPSGCLFAISKQRTVQFAWLGKPPSEQIDYDDRD